MRSVDSDILGYFKAGYKEVAFRLLFKNHGDKIYNIALFMINDPFLAEDIVQESLIKIYRNLSRFRGEAKLSTWIYRIVKNVCYDHINSSRRNSTELLQEIDYHHANLDSSSDPDYRMQKEDIHRHVREEVYRLPLKQRTVVVLYYFHEKSYEEISAIMDLPLGTIKSHIFRAKTTLASNLKELRRY